MDLSVIIAVDGDAHIIEKNIFYRQEITHDPRVVAEVSGSAGIFMDSMMEDAASYIGVVCPKIASLKNERTMKIFCEVASQDEDSWPCTIFATESTLPIILDTCECNRLVVVAPSKRNEDFAFRKWRLAETTSFLTKKKSETGYDIMIYEPTEELMVSESEMDAELDRLCGEMDNNILEPASESDRAAIEKVLDFVKGGLLVDNDHMEAFDNDYQDDVGMDEIMKDVTKYVKNTLNGFVQMPLFQRALDVQNSALKRLNTVEETANNCQKSIDSFRASMADTSSVCGEGIRRELETTNLKYNSVNERLDGIQTQLGNVIMESAHRNRNATVVPVAISVIALIIAILSIIFS